MQTRFGKPQTVTAAAHKLARLIYTMMPQGMDYVQRGQEEYAAHYRHRVVRNLKRRAHQLGHDRTPRTVSAS